MAPSGPWRRVGHSVGDTHSSNPRFLAKLHSMPPASRTAGDMASRPTRSSAGGSSSVCPLERRPNCLKEALADGETNDMWALAALRDLMRPPDGMTTIELDDGRRVSAPSGTSPAEVKRQLAAKQHVILHGVAMRGGFDSFLCLRVKSRNCSEFLRRRQVTIVTARRTHMARVCSSDGTK
jgi:hypothetical protein